jgi:hypothetical protein
MDGVRILGLGALALALMVLAAGCRSSVPLQPVTGKVTFRGALVTNGVVAFTPDATRGESGPVAYGRIREDGTYALSTGEAVGAGAGWYRITVASFSTPPPKTLTPEPFQPPVPLLPEKYRDPELSTLRCQVKSNQANTIDLTLD